MAVNPDSLPCQSSLRSGASPSACRAPRLSYYGVAALANAKSALAQSYQYLRYLLRSRRAAEALSARSERGSESQARRSLCSSASATALGNQRWDEVANIPGFAG